MSKAALIHYHGGKHRLADWIISHMPQHKLYIEPFGGAAGVLLRKRPVQTEIYNDIDNRIFNVFKTIREQPDKVAEALRLTLFSRAELDLAFEETTDPVEATRRFIIKTHLAISSTSHNQKIGFRSAINCKDYCSQVQTFSRLHNLVHQVRERFNSVMLENTTYEKLIERFNLPGVLWYFDPPYLPSTRSKSSIARGYLHDFTIEDHFKLLKAIKSLLGCVMISGYENELYNNELIGWTKVTRETLTDNRKKKTEVLWMNFQPMGIQKELF